MLCFVFHSMIEAGPTPEKVSLLMPPKMIVPKVETQATSAIIAPRIIDCDHDSLL